MRVRLTAALLAALVAPAVSFAKDIDPPHDQAAANSACYYCHNLATVMPSGAYDYNPACLGCHNQPGHGFGSPWVASDEAKPGITGSSHSWSGAARNPTYGATPDYVPQMYLVDGKLQCVMCHDLHLSTVAVAPDSMHTSIPVGVPQWMTGTTGTGSGSATLTLTAVPGSGAEGFRLKISTVAGGGGTFILSHDFGFNANSWLNWVAGAWVAGTEVGPGKPFVDGTDVALDIAGISVKWTAGAEVGDYWDFYVGYPFLRLSNVADNGCFSCHKERVMNHTRARGVDNTYLPNGVRKFSHPVGVALNANGFGTDRATVLDADGTVGVSATDGEAGVRNDSNNLVMTGGIVRCTTCHAVHNADSNSLTPDVR